MRWLAIGSWACTPQPGTVPGTTDVPVGGSTGGTSDTDDSTTYGPVGEAAAIALLQRAPRAGNLPADTTVVGIFTDSLRGWANLPMCVGQQLSETFCAESLPTAEDSWVPVVDYDDEVIDQVFTRRVGDEITVGPWTVPWFFDDEAQFGSYFGIVDPSLASGPLDLAWPGGDWDPFTEVDVLALPPAIEVLEPDPLAYHAFTDQAPVALSWVPASSGIVLLAVSTWVEDRLYLLEDDGSFSLDLGELGIDDGEPVDLMLGRWTTEIFQTNEGNSVHFSAQSDQWIYGSWRELDGRTELVPADACAAVDALESVQPGSYWGDMLAFGNQIDPGLAGSCTGFPAQGADGVVPIVVPAKGLLTASYVLPNDDASLYLVETCANPDTCVVGSDTAYVGWEESLTWFNDSDVDAELYLVLDSYLYNGLPSISDIFLLDLSLDVLGGDVLHDACADAMLAPAVGAGSFAGDLSDTVSDLDPAPFCAAPAPGGDGMVKVTLAAGQTLTATASMPDADLVVYALYHCTVPASCVAGSDATVGGTESISYTNTSGVQENLYLVLDSTGLSAGYNLDITLQ